MKKLIAMLSLVFLAINLVAAATTIPIGVKPIIPIENSPPEVYMDTSTRVLTDTFGSPLSRANNYAFEGEKITWEVLVRDSNADTCEVVTTVGPMEGPGNPAQAGCIVRATQPANGADVSSFGPGLVFDEFTDKVYVCTLTVEPTYKPTGEENMHGEYWFQVSATDCFGNEATFEEDEYFFFNPFIGLKFDPYTATNGLVFPELQSGNVGYSQTILVTSDVESGSGVILDVDIAGTDFYDSQSSAARCPNTNQLALSNFRYYATKGAFDTTGSPTADVEGYDEIDYTYKNLIRGAGNQASRMTEGSDTAITFKLNLPSPCVGNFDSGQILFQAEAV